jgi:hypothetical protein
MRLPLRRACPSRHAPSLISAAIAPVSCVSCPCRVHASEPRRSPPGIRAAEGCTAEAGIGRELARRSLVAEAAVDMAEASAAELFPDKSLHFTFDRHLISPLPMLISAGLGRNDRRRSSRAALGYSRSAHVAGLVTLRQTFVGRSHGGWLGSDLVNEGGIPRSADYFRDNFKPI